MDLSPIKPRRSTLIFGGSFDPVHQGHVALAQHFIDLLKVDELRLIPTGQPWQKAKLKASAEQRVTMLELAFADIKEVPVFIDRQEIERAEQHIASFTVDTLTNLRSQLGNENALILLIGADQFHNFATWKNWQAIFKLAHIVVAARPGYNLQNDDLPSEFANLWQQAQSSIDEFKQCCFGKTYLDTELAWDISATRIRDELQQLGQTLQTTSLIPCKVLDYIQTQKIYD
jgi:nicotinate-nucleotide adenylyltransferase